MPLAARDLEAVAALAEPTRLALLFRLGQRGGACVGDVAAEFPASRPAISFHLKVLRQAGLVRPERRGQQIHYFVEVARVVDLLRVFADALDRCCGGRGRTPRARRPAVAR